MENDDPSVFLQALDRLLADLPGTVRAVTPNMMEFRPEAGEGTVSERLGAAVKTAAVLKAVLDSDELSVEDIKVPSFASAEEAADILESALMGAKERADGTEEYWRTSVFLEGSDKWRGETRLPIALSLLEDMRQVRAVLQNVVDAAAFT